MFFSKKNKKIIGRLEYIDIPELDLYKISAKIDTGAYRGAIHASKIKEIEEDGVKKLSFHIVDHIHPDFEKKEYKMSKYGKAKFKNVNSDYEERYKIPLQILIAGKKINAELSLVDRSNLRHPVLIGRRALKKRFLIDVDKKY